MIAITTETMRCLKNLPVWVVIRLCTNDNNMTQYWNGVDSEVELNMDVIDDPLGEAKEIHKYVRTYGTPLYSLVCLNLSFYIQYGDSIQNLDQTIYIYIPMTLSIRICLINKYLCTVYYYTVLITIFITVFIICFSV